MILDDVAHAKLNLALHVRRKRPDGYHELETIFAFTALGDRLTVRPADSLTLTVDGPFAADVPTDESNLVLRAARALGSGGAAIHLTKTLPVASGIGGGSADAAAALRLLNRLWRLGRSLEALCAVGGTLGADIPACVHSRALRGEGRGDALVPVETGLAGAAVLLVNPRVAVSTAAVFAGWDGVDRGPLGAPGDWRNDLESSALAVAPAIADVLDALKAQTGVRLVRMSGSGATCFAIFGSREAASSAARAMPSKWWAEATQLL